MRNIDNLLSHINQKLESLNFVPANYPVAQEYQKEIQEAHSYPLLAGGKRIRPLLTLLMACSLAGEEALHTATPSALAVELIHTYTLVHDDLPCMDNDDLRRGRPTTHKVYGEAKGLLVGDGLLSYAFTLLCQTNWPMENMNFTKEIVETLSAASNPGGVIWGQWLDLSFTGISQTTWEQMELVHNYKTGVLIGASLELGLLCALSHCEEKPSQSKLQTLREKAKQAGLFIGLAFQIIDDILDSTQTTAQLGKTAGKDETQNKFTAIKLLGLEKCELLSAEYSKRALGLLKELASEPCFSNDKNSASNKSYLTLLFVQIESLLSRRN